MRFEVRRPTVDGFLSLVLRYESREKTKNQIRLQDLFIANHMTALPSSATGQVPVVATAVTHLPTGDVSNSGGASRTPAPSTDHPPGPRVTAMRVTRRSKAIVMT